jgi:hypothetical protein
LRWWLSSAVVIVVLVSAFAPAPAARAAVITPQQLRSDAAVLERAAPTPYVLSPIEQFPTAEGAEAEAVRLWILGRRYPVPDNSGEGRRIVYSNTRQRVWLVDDDGTLVATHLVSGRRAVPRPGSYRVFSKSELASAGHHGITMQYMVRFTHGTNTGAPIGFHEIPVYRSGAPLQRLDQLGQFRSAGCVRQSPEDALFLYNWADLGTRVVVVR